MLATVFCCIDGMNCGENKKNKNNIFCAATYILVQVHEYIQYTVYSFSRLPVSSDSVKALAKTKVSFHYTRNLVRRSPRSG